MRHEVVPLLDAWFPFSIQQCAKAIGLLWPLPKWRKAAYHSAIAFIYEWFWVTNFQQFYRTGYRLTDYPFTEFSGPKIVTD